MCIKVEWARGQPRCLQLIEARGVSFCVFLSFRGSHFLCVPDRPLGTEEVSVWAQETLGLSSLSSTIVFRAELAALVNI